MQFYEEEHHISAQGNMYLHKSDGGYSAQFQVWEMSDTTLVFLSRYRA